MEENELYQMVPGLKNLSTFSNNLGYKPCTEVGRVLFFIFYCPQLGRSGTYIIIASVTMETVLLYSNFIMYKALATV